MKRNIYFLLLAVIFTGIYASAKKPLDHDAFDSWQRVTNYAVSNNGEWNAYATVPQEGDACLYFHNNKSGKTISIERGYNPVFSADSRWGVALIKPFFSESRQAKIDKKKDLDAPQDSLAIVDLKTGKVEKIAKVSSFKIGEEGGHWLAYQSVDTVYADVKDLKDKEAGRPLIVRHLDGTSSKVVKWVKDYDFPKDGTKLAMTVAKPANDSITTNGVGVMLLPDTAFFLIDRDKKFYGNPVFDEKGTKLAYVAGNDSVQSGTKQLELYLAEMSNLMAGPREIAVSIQPRKGLHLARPNARDEATQGKLLEEWQKRMEAARKEGLFINQYSKPRFSYNGKRLIIGVAPYIAPDDTTIVDFEKADLDIWRWDAPYTPPQENKNIKKLRERTFPVVIDLATLDYHLVFDNPFLGYDIPDRWDGNWALITEPESMTEFQWNYNPREDLSVVNVITGEKKHVGYGAREFANLSPCDRYVIWYDKRNFYAYNIATGDSVCLTKGIPYPVWEEEEDYPMEKTPYGVCGWSKDDATVYIYDRYDIWAIDPDGKSKPVCFTRGEGRKTNRRYRFQKTDPDQRYFSNGDLLLFRVFDYTDKCNGFATMKFDGKPQVPSLRLLEGASFTQLKKAKKADSFSWQRASFDIAPNIWSANSLNFSRAVQLTDANPQMKDYSWGTAQLFKWNAYDGRPSEGVLYLPEDFNPDKEYPMLAVFYERSSEDLYYHYTMEPSWSWVNYPFYVSRGYVVFVPDIHYTTGIPGESAYNYVCSGVEAVCDLYPNIDRKRIGIDGQSWGGYQTAYLVTRTNMFACAGSGAPVANMTSAFGGIRWESGDSRQAQYEVGQSRIGANLWDAPELYIANSPVFHANKCNTPLLIMHNDNDGAVPWYQGIELFMALRRLHKPVWMLQYNGEAHNLRERRNRKDITIRLQQFFDHYLKDDPMPLWMKEGIPALRKGQEMGY